MILYDEAVVVWIFVGAALIFAANYLNILEAAGRIGAMKQRRS